MWLRSEGPREEGGDSSRWYQVSNELERGSPCRTLPQVPSGKEQNRRVVACRPGWRSSRAGDRVGPSVGGVYPTQGPYGPGLRASLAAAAHCRHRVPAARATARCSAVPGAPACLCAASAHHQRRRGCPGPRCQEDNCGTSLPGSSRRCLPRGEDPRDTGVPLTFSGGEKSLRFHHCAGENRRAHSLASDSWQSQQHCHQNFPGAESHFRVFLAPRPQSLFPTQTRFTAKSRKSALQKCILPRPPSPPAGLGSLPKVGARSRASCPIPGSGVLGRGAANSPW